jgi:hypothetical protein
MDGGQPLARRVISRGERPVGITLSALAYFVGAAMVIVIGIASAGSENWLARPGHALRSGVLIAVVAVAVSLVGIGLLRRSRLAFIAAVGLAAVLVLPWPPPREDQVPLYLLEATVAVGVLIVLIRNRGWFRF